MNDDINQVPSTSPDLKSELAKKLQELVPEAITDGKVDTKKLKELLDNDSADDSERFGLFWPGKKRAMRAAQEPTTATLKPVKEESKDWDTTENVFIEGDNLEVLKVLQKHYHNKIKMIYIDPPYNTGKDFVYPDNFKEGLQSYLEFTKQVDEDGRKLSTNSDTEGRYHSNWLNMMYPRLKLARNLLTDDGVIFVSIGDQELQNLQKALTEIFGENNELPLFTRITKKSSNNGTTFSPCTDYVVGFARDISNVKPFSVPLTAEQIKSYNKEDVNGKYKEIGLFQAALKHGGSRYPIKAPDGQMVNTPNGLPWRWSEAKLLDGVSKDMITFKQTKSSPLLDDLTGEQARWNVYTKLYLEDREEAGLLPKSFSDEFQNSLGTGDLRKLDLPFDFPKPVRLLQFLTSIIGDENCIVADLFSGSGTTAHAVMQVNAEDGGSRKHIQIQLPEPTEQKTEARNAGYKTISDISKERIRRAGEKIKADYGDALAKRDAPIDVGFRVFKLSDTNFAKWKTSSDTDGDKLQQHLLTMRDSSNDSATEEELLAELLIKLGVSLTTRIESEIINGLSIWKVGDNLILAYLNEHVKPSLDQLRKIAEIEPTKLIVLEDAFQGDDELKTNLSQICKTNKIELWTV